MLSILVFYCPSRRPMFEAAWEVIGPYFGEADRLLCCDGPADFEPPGFRVVEVFRAGRFYNWARVWESGLAAARHDTILYLDCDRFFDRFYIEHGLRLLDENSIVYPARTFGCKDTSRRRLTPEERTLVPPIGTPKGKNPLSGNSLLTKRVYDKVGGFDPAFEGAGYADTDFFLRALQAGVVMKEVDAPEFHLEHEPSVEWDTHIIMGIYNCRRLALKHGLKPTPHIEQGRARYLVGDGFIDEHDTMESFVRQMERRPVFL